MNVSFRDQVYEWAADLLGLRATPTRLRIVCALMEAENNVPEPVERLAVSQPNMSPHLAVLYRGGVLGRGLDGSQICYCVDHDQVRKLCRSVLVPAHCERTAARRLGTCRATRLSSVPEEQP